MRFPIRSSPVEIHEGCYLALYLVYAVLLAIHGMAGTVAFAEITGLTAGALGVIAYCHRSPDLVRWRLRWFYFMAGMGVCYHALGLGVPKFRPDSAWLLQNADRLLIGGNGGLRLEPWSHPILTELMSWCYMGFFPFLLLGLWRHGWMAGSKAGLFFRRLGLLYAIGFTGYLLCPAAGPYRDLRLDFPRPLPVGWGTWLNEAMVEWGSNRVDCFPSLHCAVSGLILAFDFRLSRTVFLWHLPIVAGIWLSTVYLGQHYFVDLLGGLVLLIIASILARPQPSDY